MELLKLLTHPILVREVVRCFLSPGSNSNDAQLVFTAHNPCLLDEDLLRRDQVWLTEKSQGATELYPLSEYSPRNDESLVSPEHKQYKQQKAPSGARNTKETS